MMRKGKISSQNSELEGMNQTIKNGRVVPIAAFGYENMLRNSVAAAALFGIERRSPPYGPSGSSLPEGRCFSKRVKLSKYSSVAIRSTISLALTVIIKKEMLCLCALSIMLRLFWALACSYPGGFAVPI